MFFLKQRSREASQRVYAIGDVHGRLDLFKRLVSIIKRDNASRLAVPTRIILLGDLVDHGPDSAAMVHYCKLLSQRTSRFVVLKGDHEAMMVDALRDGDDRAIERWLDHGGMATLASWGVPARLMERSNWRDLVVSARHLIDSDVLAWMDTLPPTSRHEDYLFVHAGLRPEVPLKKQSEHDLLTIRGDFLRSKADHGLVVIHGHSIHESGPDIHSNRIGIDSGAYRTGRLSALGVENGQVWPLITEPDSADQARAAARSELDDFVAGLRAVG